MDYHLKPLSKTCSASGEELAPGSRCHSVLVEQNGQLLRLDFAENAWSGPPEGTLAHWRTVVPDQKPTKAKPLDPEVLLRYFEQLCEDANPAQDKFLYILALLLVRKKRLKLEGSRQDGEIEYLQLIGSAGEGPYEVRNQQLDDDEIEQLQSELNTHLEAEWS